MTQGFSPTVDGNLVPQHPFHPAASAVNADIPLLIGSTRTEVTYNGEAADFALTEDAMRARVAALPGVNASEAVDVYRRANPGASPSDIYFLIASDHRYGGPVMKIAERRAALRRAPVYLYNFRWETALDGGRMKSPHAVEVPLVFDNVKASRLTADTPDAQAVADRLSAAWIAFAHRRSEFFRAPPLAGIQCGRLAHHGYRQGEQTRQRSHQRTAPGDVSSPESQLTRLLILPEAPQNPLHRCVAARCVAGPADAIATGRGPAGPFDTRQPAYL